MKTTKTIFSEGVPKYEPDETYVNVFTQEVITMRNLLQLKASLDTDDSVGILNALLSMLLYLIPTPPAFRLAALRMSLTRCIS